LKNGGDRLFGERVVVEIDHDVRPNTALPRSAAGPPVSAERPPNR